jgi:hypothetical protein
MKSVALRQVAWRMKFLLLRRKGVADARLTGQTLSWVLDRDDWFTPVWTYLSHYSGDPKLVRFRNDLVTRLPKSQWPFEQPRLFRYELTAFTDELTDKILTEIIDYSELARIASHAQFDRHPPRFGWGGQHGNYGWTKRAWEYQTKKSS